MRTVSRSALVPYSSEQMFALVDDIDRYPEFLPWCESTRVHERTDTTVEASIELKRAGLSQTFRTRNTNTVGERISLALVDGPFKALSGEWRFEQRGDAGCRVSLDIEFEFEGRFMDKMLGPFFEEICNKLVNSFTQRAAAIYT